MSNNVYLDALKPSQRTPIPGREREMVQNHAGGYTFSVDEFAQFKRWILLGSQVGTLYKSADALTSDNITNIKQMISDSKSKDMLAYAVEVSTQGRVVKLDQTFVLLALVFAYGSKQDKAYARKVFSKLVRTPYHLVQFLNYTKQLRGFGRAVRTAVSEWYRSNPNYAYHMLKYRQRDGWTHMDILRVMHVKPANAEQDAFFRWYFDYFFGGKKDGTLPNELAEKFIKIQSAKTPEEIIPLLGPDVPWEFLPNQFLRDKQVWEAMIPYMPYHAYIRNLPKIASMGIPIDTEKIKNVHPKMHPFQMFMALKYYSTGKNRNLRWEVSLAVKDALEYAARAAFRNVPPIEGRAVVGVDVSGSMFWQELDTLGHMYPGEAAGVMAQIIMSQFQDAHIMAFTSAFRHLNITPATRFSKLRAEIKNQAFGNTDCSLPMRWAADNNIEADVFVVLTDNETWYGGIHPTQALEQYRHKMGINAGLIVCAFEPTSFTIADPRDPKQVDICGADASLPQIIETVVREF